MRTCGYAYALDGWSSRCELNCVYACLCLYSAVAAFPVDQVASPVAQAAREGVGLAGAQCRARRLVELFDHNEHGC